MQYMMAFYENDAAIEARSTDDESFWRGWRDFFAALGDASIIISGAPLQDADRAVTVRVASDAPVVHEGPYADTKEQLGGFVVIDVPSLDEALAWARRCPAAREGAVEVRPVFPPEQPCGPPAVPGRTPAAGRGNANFMLTLYEAPEEFAQREGPQSEQYWSEWIGFGKALRDASIFTDGAALREPGTATVVRIDDDGLRVQDGPYADTKEQLGGYVLIDVPSIDEALAWAARSPAAFRGAVEVRPLMKIGAPV